MKNINGSKEHVTFKGSNFMNLWPQGLRDGPCLIPYHPARNLGSKIGKQVVITYQLVVEPPKWTIVKNHENPPQIASFPYRVWGQNRQNLCLGLLMLFSLAMSLTEAATWTHLDSSYVPILRFRVKGSSESIVHSRQSQISSSSHWIQRLSSLLSGSVNNHSLHKCYILHWDLQWLRLRNSEIFPASKMPWWHRPARQRHEWHRRFWTSLVVPTPSPATLRRLRRRRESLSLKQGATWTWWILGWMPPQLGGMFPKKLPKTNSKTPHLKQGRFKLPQKETHF